MAGADSLFPERSPMTASSTTYLTSIAAGIAAALIACVIYIVGMIGLGLGWPLLQARLGSEGAGAGSVVVDSGSLLAIAAIAFALGAFWKFRRSPARRAAR
jgi:hypothetical protein